MCIIQPFRYTTARYFSTVVQVLFLNLDFTGRFFFLYIRRAERSIVNLRGQYLSTYSSSERVSKVASRQPVLLVKGESRDGTFSFLCHSDRSGKFVEW